MKKMRFVSILLAILLLFNSMTAVAFATVPEADEPAPAQQEAAGAEQAAADAPADETPAEPVEPEPAQQQEAEPEAVPESEPTASKEQDEPAGGQPESEPVEEQPQPVEWIWVVGYKGTDKDMKCYNDFQYELGKTYKFDGEIVECQNGSHFCLTLHDVMEYVRFNFSNRYFKVKALVRKSDYENYGKHVRIRDNDSRFVDKLVAKEICLIEEVSTEEIWEAGNRHSYSRPEWIDTIDEFKTIHNIEEYRKFAYEKAFNMVEGEYSEAFITVVFSRNMNPWCLGFCSLNEQTPKRDFVEEMLAYAEEGLSPDMRAFLLLK